MSRTEKMVGARMRAIVLDEDRNEKLTDLADRYQVSRSYMVRHAIDQLYGTLKRTGTAFPPDRAP